MTKRLFQSSVEGLHEAVSVSIRNLRDISSADITADTHVVQCKSLDYVRLNLKSDVQIGFSGAVFDGQQIVVAFVQADTVPRTITFDESVRYGTDIFAPPALTSELGKLDRFLFMFDSIANKYDLVGYSRGY